MTYATEPTRTATLAALSAAAAFYRDQLAASWVPQYLQHRGLSAALRYRWGTGYAPAGWETLTNHLRGDGHSYHALHAAGLATIARTGTAVDRFRDRLMLPIRDPDGTVIGFIGRQSPTVDDPTVPRWLNSPTTATYQKNEVLYGLAEAQPALNAGATLAVTEGPLDAIAVTEAGRGAIAGIALCGTALTRTHVDLIARFARGPVAVALDPDTAGSTAAAAAWPVLQAVGIAAAQADLPGGCDPARTFELHGATVLVEAVTRRAHPLVEAALAAAVEPWVDTLDEVESRVAAARAALPILAQLDAEQISSQATALAIGLGLSPQALTGWFLTELGAARTKAARSRRGQEAPPVTQAIHGAYVEIRV